MRHRHPHPHPHRHGWHPYWHHHHRHPVGLRHYFGAHLHRRLFLWFGASIFLTTGIISGLAHATGGRGPGRGLAALCIAVGTLWILSGKIARRIARPLSELVHVAEEIGAGRLRARASVPPWRIGEIAVLARAINDMAARIEQQIADQRELLAGVSHEIRTPLARIRVLLELGRQNAEGVGAGAGAAGAVAAGAAHPTRPILDELEREVIEIDALVGELLASARLDFAALSPRPLDGVEVARRALERAGLPPEVLRVAAETDARFEGDATLMARALANLLDNARRHGGGVDALRVRAREGVVAFDVEDRGPGFPTDEKNPQRAEGSLGLGLVLVRRIADAHRGALIVGNRAEGGARVTLEVSREPAADGAGSPGGVDSGRADARQA